MRYVNELIFSAVDISTNQTSGAVDCSYLVAGSLQGVATGTVAGTLKLQYSNDSGTPTNWSDVPSATVSITNTGVYSIPKTDLCYRFVRAVYTSTSGSGTLTARLNCQGF